MAQFAQPDKQQLVGLDIVAQERAKYLIEQLINVVPALKELTGITNEAREAVEREVTDFALSIKTSKLDKEQLEVFFKKPYFLEPVPRRSDSWYLIIPKFVDVRFGWLEPSSANEAYNKFLLNRYMDWLGEIPQAIKKQLDWKTPPELVLEGEELHGSKEALNYAWEKYRPLLHDRDENRIKINGKRAFDLIASLVKDGILPFSIKPVDPADFMERKIDFQLREYQQQAWDELKKYSAIGVFYPPSTGKCHRKGQKLLMYDGSLRAVESLKVGDKLMGPDSLPRIILSVSQGRGRMVEIRPLRGKSWVVNEDHVLSLVRNGEASLSSSRHRIPYYQRSGEITDVSVRDWSKWSNNKKRHHKLFHVGVNFSSACRLPIDPYFLGILLGDGGLAHGKVDITTQDPEISDVIHFQADHYAVYLREEKAGNATTYIFTRGRQAPRNEKGYPMMHLLGKQLREMGLLPISCDRRFIPAPYLVASKAERASILAGLIDTDGCYDERLNAFEFTSKSKGLAKGVAFLARSLGLYANLQECKKGCQGGFVGRYYRVYIKGDLTNIPCRVKRKIPISKRSRTNPLRVGFTVASLPGEEDYYGFTLTGDGRYLLDDFTVTHNTVIGLWVMTHLKPKHLVVVPTRLLQEQWLERIETHTDLKPEEYAVMTYQAAITKAAKEQWTTKIIDEVHHLPANTFVKLALIKAKYTVGLSASPFREDGREEYVFALSGKPVGLSWEYFKELNIIKSPTCHVWIVKNFDAKMKRLEGLLETDRRTIIFSDSIQMGETIKAKFKIPFVNGTTKDNMDTINANRTVVVSRVGDEGMSLPDIERVIEVSWLGGCYDAQTEVLTEDGWKLFANLAGYDRVATLNPSGGIEYCKPEDYQKFGYSGSMVHFKGRSYDLLVTPNHNMYIRSAKNSRGFYFTQAEYLAGCNDLKGKELCRSGTWIGADRETFVLPEPELTEYVSEQKQLYEKAVAMKKDGLSDLAIAAELQVNYFTVHYWLEHNADPLNRQKRLVAKTEIPLEPFLKLLAWYVSEGSIDHDRAVKLAQTDLPHRSEIIQVVKDCGYEPSERNGHISIYSKQLAQCVAAEAGEGAEAKHLPRWLFALPSYRLKVFLTELLKGDGSDERKYYTGSTQLGNDVQELALKCGYAATVIVRGKRKPPLLKGRPIIAKLPQIEVYISYVQLTPQIWTEPTMEEYNGFVYCLTVPNHTLYVRRNGRAVWCGNSRRQELQRTTRLLHSQTDEQENHVLMTLEEYLRDRKRLFAIMDKGFKIVLHREGVSEKVIEQHEQNGYVPQKPRVTKKTENLQETVSAPMSGQSATFTSLPGVQRILNLMNTKEKQLFTLLLDHDGSWFSREKLPLLLGYASDDTMRHSIDFTKMVERGWIETQRQGRASSYRTNMRGKMGG